MSKNFGWITLNRQITSHWLWNCEPYSKAQAWLDLLLHANHTDTKIIIKGTLIDLKRGQQARSQVTLSEQWKWSRDKVKRFLKLLENDGMIIQHTSQLTSIISICNYSSYQDKKDSTSQQISQQASQVSSQQADSRQVTVNNDNNVDNEKLIKQNIPYQLIADAYNEHFAIPTGNSVVNSETLSDKRKNAIKRYWNKNKKLNSNSLEYWITYFSHCATFPNMMNGSPRGENHKNWNPNLDYLLTDNAFDKARENRL
jgi:hypothetical protein